VPRLGGAHGTRQDEADARGCEIEKTSGVHVSTRRFILLGFATGIALF
jgi:hypothetical protein